MLVTYLVVAQVRGIYTLYIYLSTKSIAVSNYSGCFRQLHKP